MESKYVYSGKLKSEDSSDSKISKFLWKRKNDGPFANFNVKSRNNINSCKLFKKSDLPYSETQTTDLNGIPQTALPVYKCQDRIVQELCRSETLLIMGETGTGKTTQIPQFLLTAGYAEKGLIGVSQPRRVAAITIAKRVAQENGSQLGEIVGYSVRFEDCTSEFTRIRFLTDGTLLREALSDRLLRRYSVLMLDEAHERTINNDILFCIVKEAQKQRNVQNMTPLKLIITSATMDIDHFSTYFGVQGMYLEGKTYPVKVMHSKKSQSDYLHAALVTLFNIHRSAPANHDVLVFLTGQEEIESMAQQVRLIAKTHNVGIPSVRVFPLYAQLPQNKQLECFFPSASNSRKIILSTNIAETSITIPGIRYVVDCGYVKQRIFNSVSGLDVLTVVRISQAQSWQRCGRAGRNAKGICYRTYTKSEMEEFEPMTKPEILRSNISSTILQLLSIGVDCNTFDFLDKPSFEVFESGYKILRSLGAINNKIYPEISPLGRKMAQFPLEPKYSKLILTAPSFGCMEEMLSLVAVLSSDNIFLSIPEKRDLAALAHTKFESKHGDHLTLLNVFSAFEKTEKIKLWCHDNFLNLRNLIYAREVRKQLLEIAKGMELQINSCGNNFDSVRKCILAGFFDNIAELQQDSFYMTNTGRLRAKIHPSSVLYDKYKPEFIIFTDIVLSERIFLKLITVIDSEWINEILPTHCFLKKSPFPL